MKTTKKKTRKNTKPRADKGKHHKDSEFNLFALFIAQTTDERMTTFGFYRQDEFAKKHHIDPTTLVAWKKDPNFWKLRDENMVMLKQFTVQVLEGIRNRATNQGDANAGKLWLKFVEKWSEKVEVSVVDAGEARDQEEFS